MEGRNNDTVMCATPSDRRSEDDDGGGSRTDIVDRASSSPSSSSPSPSSSSPKRLSTSNIPSLVCALMASLTSGGTNFAFGIYSSDLKRNLGLSQGNLNSIATAMFIAGGFSWISGLATDRFGARYSICFGGAINAITLLLFWSIASEFIVIHNWMQVPTLAFLALANFLSSGLLIGSVFKIIVACCGQKTKGTFVGLSKGYHGLGAGTYACIFEAIRQPHESALDYLPMAAFFAFISTTIPAIILLPTTNEHHCTQTVVVHDQTTRFHIALLYISLVTMGCIIVSDSLLQLYQQHQLMQDNRFGMATVMISLWVGPIVALMVLPRRDSNSSSSAKDATTANDAVAALASSSSSDDRNGDGCETPATSPSTLGVTNETTHLLANRDVFVPIDDDDDDDAATTTMLEEENEELDDEEDQAEDQAEERERDILTGGRTDTDATALEQHVHRFDYDMGLRQMLRTPSAWLMLWTSTIIIGSGVVQTSNMAQMVEALRLHERVTPVSVALFSVAQATAMVITGAVSDFALNWKSTTLQRCGIIGGGIPRTYFFVVASSVCLRAQLIFMVATEEIAFVLGVVLSGVSFGMVWPLVVLVVGDLFGTANMGANYMFYNGFTLSAGTLFLLKFLAQSVYQSHIDESSPDPNRCMGRGCFQLTHTVIAMLAVSCVFTSLLLVYTARHAYSSPQDTTTTTRRDNNTDEEEDDDEENNVVNRTSSSSCLSQSVSYIKGVLRFLPCSRNFQSS